MDEILLRYKETWIAFKKLYAFYMESTQSRLPQEVEDAGMEKDKKK